MENKKDVPFMIFEDMVSRYEHIVKRLIVALVVAVVLFFASNIAWLLYESQFQTLSYVQDGTGLNNINIGDQGDLEYVANSNNKN